MPGWNIIRSKFIDIHSLSGYIIKKRNEFLYLSMNSCIFPEQINGCHQQIWWTPGITHNSTSHRYGQFFRIKQLVKLFIYTFEIYDICCACYRSNGWLVPISNTALYAVLVLSPESTRHPRDAYSQTWKRLSLPSKWDGFCVSACVLQLRVNAHTFFL